MAQADDLASRAAQIVTQLSKHDFAAAEADFDSTMKAALAGEKLSEAWNGLQGQVGQYKGQKSTRAEEYAGYRLIVVTAEFEKADIDIRVAFDAAGRVAGLTFAPSQPPVPEFQTASYVDTKAFRKSEVTIGSADWALPGTLTVPWGGGLAPAVVLVHGSGPNDRDETIGPNKPFRDLAEGLSSLGIAVLRYDKRTYKHGQKMIPFLDSLTVKEETIDDAIAAVNILKKTPGIDTSKIFVLGHSLGGTLIPRIGQAGPGIAGFIVMAGATKPLEDLVVEQIAYIFALDGDISEAERGQLEPIQTQVAFVKSDSLTPNTPREKLPLGMPARYWLDLRAYNPAESARNLNRPMLILQGERDYQVTMENFAAWKKALGDRKDVTFISYPELNHLFIQGKGKSSPDEYNQPGHVSIKVIQDIANWVKGR
ncbi:MAG: hypothetical protein A2W25_06910 [candidate division Zixibacteria bacterium RBG_16_53_22]|nr:MAG: hypothetical protein A2W25_06910 [candidate division Zixibacteria bacterium RBG_16_53_22]